MTDRCHPGLLACAFAASLLVSSCRAEHAQPPVGLSWKLIDNLPENRYQAELTLTNESGASLTGDWALYFNSAGRIVADSVSAGFEVEHVNGDLYVLRPAAGGEPLGAGQRRAIRWDGSPWAINVSDAPSGCYLILGDPSAESATPTPIALSVEPMASTARLMRGKADAVPVVTAESRYRANERLQMLPPNELTPVVPKPVALRLLPGNFVVRPTTPIQYEASLKQEAEFLAASLEPLLGRRPATVPVALAKLGSEAAIRLRLSRGLGIAVGDDNKSQGDAAYHFTIDPAQGIEIVGTDPTGVFYGIQTLRALLPLDAYQQPADELSVAALRIADAPRFGYRGVHLDVARNFQSKETVLKLLDLMSFYKLNRFHWHLTDDEGWRIEIRALPELTQVGAKRGHTPDDADQLLPSQGSGPVADETVSAGSGFYTQDDIVEVLRYAAERHIEVIPEIDLPGHGRAAIKAMEARRRKLAAAGDEAAAEEFLLTEPGDKSKYESIQLWRDNVVDVGRESTYRFLDVVVKELAAIYKRAGARLKVLHLGGDEVPNGAWEGSPACVKIELDQKSSIPQRGQYELHFLRRAQEILALHGIRAAVWEDCPLLTLGNDGKSEILDPKSELPLVVYVWNNVWGWGREDAAYRLANAGFDVVLANATHLYFDLAYEKDPAEPGYYWAGFVSTRAPFELVPLDLFQNFERDTMGQPIPADGAEKFTRLTDEGRRHIVGIQGELWGENLRSAEQVDYMAFPRLIALAERAWAKEPAWATNADPELGKLQLDRDWNEFANRLGQRELRRLDSWSDGVAYRLPPPGAVVVDGTVRANVEYPGLAIRYTTDGTEPTAASTLYASPVAANGAVKLKSFDSRGRGSRTTTVALPEAEAP